MSEIFSARVEHLKKKYSGISKKEIVSMEKIDPSKGKALEWMVRGYIANQILWPEDASRVLEALQTYFSLKRSPRLLSQYGVHPDISKYTLNDLEEIHRKVHGIENRQSLLSEIPEGAKKIYDDGKYAFVKVTTPEAASALADSTSWCTRHLMNAKKYLSRGPLYVIYEDGKKLAQTDLHRQFLNIYDRICSKVKDPNLHLVVLRNLNYLAPYIDPIRDEAVLQDFLSLLKTKKRGKEILSFFERQGLSQDILSTYSLDTPTSLEIWKNTGCLRNSSLEKLIEKSESYIVTYMSLVKERVPSLEKVFFRKASLSRISNYVLRTHSSRCPEVEAILKSSPTLWKKYLSKFSGDLSVYQTDANPTENITTFKSWVRKNKSKGRNPEIEKVILDKKFYPAIYLYTEKIIKDRWPEAEALFKDDLKAWGYYLSGIFHDSCLDILPKFINKKSVLFKYMLKLTERLPLSYEKEVFSRLKGTSWVLGDYITSFITREDPHIESYIKDSSYLLITYAFNVKKRRWPEVESCILQDHSIAYTYYTKFFKEPWPEFEQLPLEPNLQNAYRLHLASLPKRNS